MKTYLYCWQWLLLRMSLILEIIKQLYKKNEMLKLNMIIRSKSAFLEKVLISQKDLFMFFAPLSGCGGCKLGHGLNPFFTFVTLIKYYKSRGHQNLLLSPEVYRKPKKITMNLTGVCLVSYKIKQHIENM